MFNKKFRVTNKTLQIIILITITTTTTATTTHIWHVIMKKNQMDMCVYCVESVVKQKKKKDSEVFFFLQIVRHLQVVHKTLENKVQYIF